MVPERALTPRADAVQGFLYAVAAHSQPGSGVSLHGCSFLGARYRVMLTSADESAWTRFFEGLNRDLAGFLAELHGWESCRFEIEVVESIDDDVEAAVAALARLARESGLVPA